MTESTKEKIQKAMLDECIPESIEVNTVSQSLWSITENLIRVYDKLETLDQNQKRTNSDIRTMISPVEKRLQNLEESLEQFKYDHYRTVCSLKNSTADDVIVTGLSENYQTSTHSLQNKISLVTSEMTLIREAFSALNERIDGIIGNLTETVGGHVSDYSAKLDSYGAQLNAIFEEINRLNDALQPEAGVKDSGTQPADFRSSIHPHLQRIENAPFWLLAKISEEWDMFMVGDSTDNVYPDKEPFPGIPLYISNEDGTITERDALMTPIPVTQKLGFLEILTKKFSLND